MTSQDGWTWDVTPISAPRLPSIPGYELQAQLGTGGAGRVYRALDAAGRAVAVKVIPRADLTERSLARFAREGELLARLRHPGVVAVHAWGQTDEHCYMVCELVEGQHIDQAARAFDLEARIDLLVQLARAVAALHERGLVHRDLKPGNVLVDRDGRVRVIDLGVSAGEGLERLTQTGQFVGTPLYAAPERLAGAPGSDAPAGDVWALGAIAYEVLTGQHPYPVTAVTDLARRAEARPPSPRRLRPDLPRAVAAEVVRALSPDPARRHADAGALADALDRARRRRGAFGPIVVACAAAVVVALIAGAWSLRPHDVAPPPPIAAAPVATTTRAASAPAVTSTPAAAPPPTAASPPDLSALRATCEALAAEGRWSELHEALAERRALPPELRRLRGLGALFTGLDVSPLDLDHDDPVLELERRRLVLFDQVIAATPARAQRGLDEALELVRDARAVPPSHPGRLEVRRRIATVVRDMMVLVGALSMIATLDVDRARTLLGEAAELDGADRDGLRVAAAWVEFGRAATRPDVPLHAVLSGPAAEVPAPGPWLDALPEQIAAIAVGLHLASGRASALPAPRHVEALDLLRAVGAPGARLRRHALRALGDLEQDAAALAFRAGDVERGRALVARALADLREGNEGAQVAPRPLRWVSLLLMAGEVETARTIVELMDPGNPRRLLLAECDLVEGKPLAAARRAAATPAGRFEGWARRLELHARVLMGELSAAEALAQVAPAGDATEEQQGPPWHTEEGLRHVLQGGWWPGKDRSGRR